MWKSVFDFVRWLFAIAEDSQRTKADVKEVQQQLRDVVANQTRQQYDIQMLKERQAWERERKDYEGQIEELRKEVKQLKEQRALPPAPPDDEEDE